MPAFNHGKTLMFDRSFDTESHHTNDSNGTGPSSRSRRTTVPFVNDRLEFDPRYDPRRPETSHLFHQPSRRGNSDDEHRISPDTEHSSNNLFAAEAKYRASHNLSAFFDDDMHFHQITRNQQLMHSDVIRNNIPTSHSALNSFHQTRQFPAPGNTNFSSWKVGHQGAFFQPEDARLDRPFDEASQSHRGSTAEIDSLDEVLQQDSFTTATETTGEDRFENVLSAIEEHPSLEVGSNSYSFTQLSAPKLPLKSADSIGDRGMSSRSRSPLNTGIQTQNGVNVFRTKPEQSAMSSSAKGVLVTPESVRGTRQGHRLGLTTVQESTHSQQSARSPMRTRGWEPSTPTSAIFGASSHSTRSPMRIARWETSTPMSAITGTSARSNRMTPPDTLSAASSSLSPSAVARTDAEKLVQNFSSGRRKKETSIKQVNDHNPTEPIPAVTSVSTTEDTHTLNSEEQDLTLHDLCGESASVDDVAWRNALHVLAIQPQLASVLDTVGWTPLHVACLGSSPPPVFMTRSLLYVYKEAAQKVDGGGRLPLHLVAASSGDAETMELLIQEYPQAVYQTDCHGWTPLHLMLKNISVELHLNHCRILLGLMTPKELPESTRSRILQRRGEHLSLQVEELDRVVPKTIPVTRLAQESMHEEAFRECPHDVQVSLRKLCQWKRKRRRQTPQSNPDDAVSELDIVPWDAETNPAAHFTPVKQQLPIHIVVRRGLTEGRGNCTYLTVDGDDDKEEPTTSAGLAPRFIDLVRLLVAFYPEGLVARDFNGHTPLLAALSMNSAQPSLELVELLLGKRTSGYNSLPSWAQDISFCNMSADRYLNPAMVACIKSHQLPLHIVAEEMADNHFMISSVQSCYPGAIQCQDVRGRTPLHILLRNYRRSHMDSRTIALLLSDTVAQTLDDQGKLPFDLLTEKAKYIPLEQPQLKKPPEAAEDDILTFKKFFEGTIIASSEPNKRNRFDSDRFLWQLRSLPPWLRRHACAASFVQELIIEELASPLKCALIMLYAVLLCGLIGSFRLQVQKFIESPDSTTNTHAWTELAVFTSASGLLLFQLIFWSLCMSMSEFLNLCVFNIWRWVDLFSLFLTCVATVMLNYLSLSDEVTLATATAATGMLWFSAVGFFASWWYGASIFVAYLQKVRVEKVPDFRVEIVCFLHFDLIWCTSDLKLDVLASCGGCSIDSWFLPDVLHYGTLGL